jgi:hypothetical protein
VLIQTRLLYECLDMVTARNDSSLISIFTLRMHVFSSENARVTNSAEACLRDHRPICIKMIAYSSHTTIGS